MIELFGFGKKDSSGKEKFWSSKRILLVLLVVVGLVLGMILEHYLVEPAIGEQFKKQFLICKKGYDLLNEEIDQCYSDFYSCCEGNLEKCPATET